MGDAEAGDMADLLSFDCKFWDYVQRCVAPNLCMAKATRVGDFA